ncbi:MAG TPA: class I SAM-dependent methyltransferase [Nevskiaceae bacterium]|nr:class I SAM-dependent methyltransferase [Nevskiaceae bacterium]
MSEIEYHRKLLGDRVRNAAFHEALKRSIKPGKTTVLDIGAGTGFLSFLARKLGAQQCTLIEYTDMLDVAEAIARANRFDGLALIKGHSGELRGLPKFDLVVSETLGNFALEEGMLETLVDARRFLARGGQIMPMRLRQFVAPVVRPRLQKEVDVWRDVGFDIDLAAARAIALDNMYVKAVTRADLGGSTAHAQQWDELDFRPSARPPSSLRHAQLSWSARKLGSRVFGFALWWECELVPGVTLSTSPSAKPTHWEQIYLPLLELLVLQPSDRIELHLTSDTRPHTGLDVQWKTIHRRGSRTISTQQQNIAKGRVG